MPTTLTVSPTPSPTATKQDLSLNILLSDEDWEGKYDKLDVLRSRMTDAGPYEYLTGSAYLPAAITGAVVSPVLAIAGLTLLLRVNESFDISVTFTGVNPISIASAATQIAAASLGLLQAQAPSNALMINTVPVGAVASLRIVGGNAAPLLGLPLTEPSSVALGKDARIALTPSQQVYEFTDHNGSLGFFYRTRFYNSTTGASSDFSAPIAGKDVSPLLPSMLVQGYLRLVDIRGVPSRKEMVLLYPQMNGTTVEGRVMVSGALSKATDDDGRVEFTLLRGQQFTLAIAGVSLARDITTPTDLAITSFNMLDPQYAKDDLFNVQQPAIDFGARRTL